MGYTMTTNEKRIGVKELRLHIGQHLDDVLRGVRLVITRQGRPIAIIMEYEEYERLRAGDRNRERPTSTGENVS